MEDEKNLASLVTKLESSEPVSRTRTTSFSSSSSSSHPGSRKLSGAVVMNNNPSSHSPPSPIPTSSSPATSSAGRKMVDTKFKFQFQTDQTKTGPSSPLIDQQVQKMIQQAAKEKESSQSSGLWGFVKKLSSIDGGSSGYSTPKSGTPQKSTVGSSTSSATVNLSNENSIQKKNQHELPKTNDNPEEDVFDFDDPISFQKKSRQFSTEKQEEKFDWDENISQEKLRSVEEILFPNLFSPSNNSSSDSSSNNDTGDVWPKLKNLCWSGAPKRYRPLLWRILLSTYPGSSGMMNMNMQNNNFQLPTSSTFEQSTADSSIQNLDLSDPSSYETVFSNWKNQFSEQFRKFSLGFESVTQKESQVQQFARTMDSTNFDSVKTTQYQQFKSAYYDREYKSEYEKQQLKQIMIDLPRTFPDLPLFKNIELQDALERSLYIWAIRHPGSGYVQGMNDIASVFLIVLIQEKFDFFLNFCSTFSKPEQQIVSAQQNPKNIFFIDNFKEFIVQNQRKNFLSFLETKKVTLYSLSKTDRDNLLKYVDNEVKNTMDTMFEEHLKLIFDGIESDGFWFFNFFVDWIQDYYTPSQPGIRRMMNLLGDLTKKIDPAFYKFLTEKHMIDFSQFTFRWMNCLLMRELPLHLIIRLFDAYIAEGGKFPDLHVFVCLAFLLNFKPHIMKCDEYAKIMMFLQNPPTSKWKNSDVEVLLSKAFLLKSMYG